MRLRKDNKEYIDRRRVQNRMAQRRFRQRQAKERELATTTATVSMEPQVQATSPSPPNPSNIQVEQDVDVSLNSTSSVEVSTKTSAAADPLQTSYGFGVRCLLGGSNGLLGILDHTNMHNVKFASSSQVDFNFTSSVTVPFSAGGGGFPESDSDTLEKQDESVRNNDAGKSEILDGFLPTSGTQESEAQLPSISRNSEEEKQPNSSSTSGFLTPLHIAARNGNDRIVRMLLQHNVDCDEPDSEGLTALIHATICGHEDVVSVLLAHGAQIGRVDGQCRTALHWAVLRKRVSILKSLLKHCADDQRVIDYCDSDGMTPLLKSIDVDFEAGVELLLHSGADGRHRMKSVVQQ